MTFRRGPWAATATLAMLRTQLQQLADTWTALADTNDGTPYDQGACDAYWQAADELRHTMNGDR